MKLRGSYQKTADHFFSQGTLAKAPGLVQQEPTRTASVSRGALVSHVETMDGFVGLDAGKFEGDLDPRPGFVKRNHSDRPSVELQGNSQEGKLQEVDVDTEAHYVAQVRVYSPTSVDSFIVDEVKDNYTSYVVSHSDRSDPSKSYKEEWFIPQ